MVLRIDDHGPSALLLPDDRPETILVADPDGVVGLAVGAISIERALTIGELTGDPSVLRAVFAHGPINLGRD